MMRSVYIDLSSIIKDTLMQTRKCLTLCLRSSYYDEIVALKETEWNRVQSKKLFIQSSVGVSMNDIALNDFCL